MSSTVDLATFLSESRAIQSEIMGSDELAIKYIEPGFPGYIFTETSSRYESYFKDRLSLSPNYPKVVKVTQRILKVLELDPNAEEAKSLWASAARAAVLAELSEYAVREEVFDEPLSPEMKSEMNHFLYEMAKGAASELKNLNLVGLRSIMGAGKGEGLRAKL